MFDKERFQQSLEDIGFSPAAAAREARESAYANARQEKEAEEWKAFVREAGTRTPKPLLSQTELREAREKDPSYQMGLNAFRRIAEAKGEKDPEQFAQNAMREDGDWR
jgi:hypothetical protein